MAIRTLLKYRNLDLTKDLNDRYTDLFIPGIFDGGDISTVPGQLKVDLSPWKIVSADGMVVTESAVQRIDIPEDQTSILAVRAIYKENDDPDVEVIVEEESAFNLLTDVDKHEIFARFDVPLGATEILPSHINLEPRDILDKLGRNILRGIINSVGALPASGNVLGDIFMVVDGVGGAPNLYGWDGLQWVVMTDIVGLTADFTAHRNNLLPDEKHLTDDEKDAVAGSSGNAVNSSNKLVDEGDTRLPTQDENDALAGSHGTPSTANKYVTEELPFPISTEKEFATPSTSTFDRLMLVDGPVFVGKAGVGSANQYFRFYENLQTIGNAGPDNFEERREYRTASGNPVIVIGVFTDAGLTSPLDPATDPNVDINGFYNGSDLYIQFDVVPDTEHRLVYSKKFLTKNLPVDAFLRRNSLSAQISSQTLKVVEDVKGRPWDTTPPVNEQNIELRKDIVDLKEYVSSVFRADHIIGEFEKVDAVPDFDNDFIKNIGIPHNFSFENTSQESFTYDSSTGKVTYGSAVSLGSVLAGHVFIDGDLREYKVTSSASPDVFITHRDGSLPETINTAVTEDIHGSIKPDNNPRNINLATMEYITGGRERIMSRELEVVPNEYHLETGNVAYQIRKPLHSPFFKEPRVRFYGSFLNQGNVDQSQAVAIAKGRILVTGFFTDLKILADIKGTSPTIDVVIDGVSSGSIDLSRSGDLADLGDELDVQYHSVTVASNLADLVPHTVELIVNSGNLPIHGFDLLRFTTGNSIVLPGRGFVQSDLHKSDAITSVANQPVGVRRRGSITKSFIDRSLIKQTITEELTDFDGTSNPPTGNAVAASSDMIITSGLAKLELYKSGDIVRLVTASDHEIKIIDSFGPSTGQVNFTSPISVSGPANLMHICSVSGLSKDPAREYARHIIDELTPNGLQSDDLNIPKNVVFTVEDGTTSIAAKNVEYTASGIDGAGLALKFIDGTSTASFRAICSRFDLLTANDSASTADISIDGSPFYSISIPGDSLARVPILLNARYQTHEIRIKSSSNLAIVGIILHEPTLINDVEGAKLAQQNLLARHLLNRDLNESAVSFGTVGMDPHIMGGLFVNGSGIGLPWDTVIDFTENPDFGRYTTTDKEGSYFEFDFQGESFEIDYSAGPDRGKPIVTINGVVATAANFPTAAFEGIDSSNGELDMFENSVTRKKASIIGLSFGRYTVKVLLDPRTKNPLSSGFSVNILAFFEANSNGLLSVTPSSDFKNRFIYGLDAARDERNFDSGAIAREEVPVIRTVLGKHRAKQIGAGSLDISAGSLSSGSTEVSIDFSQPLVGNFVVKAEFFNTIDVDPLIQNIVVNSQSSTGFTARWNMPLDSNNYIISYLAIEEQ